jgi:hypothetical protein
MKNSRLTIIVSGMFAAVTVSIAGQAIVGSRWPDQEYRVEWAEVHVPAEVAAGVRLAVPVDMRNSGNRVWPASQVFVSYHWFRGDRLVVWDGERTRLPRDLRAGSRAALAVRVATPAEPGSYLLQLTLVHELVTWFEQRGATMFIQPVAVRPLTQSIDCGRNRSTPCTATH